MPNFSDQQYDIEVVDQNSLDGFSAQGAITSGCLVFVYDAGTKTLSTIYADSARTAKTNAITRAQFATDTRIRFYSAATSHDIFVAHSDGSVQRYTGVTPNVHKVMLNRDGVNKCLVAPYAAANNVETDTGLDFPRHSIVREVLVEVTTAQSTEGINVGLNSSETAGDIDGFVVNADLGNTGFQKPYTISGNALISFTNASGVGVREQAVKGALLGFAAPGNNSGLNTGTTGGVGHIINTNAAVSLSYQDTAGTNTAVGYIYAYFEHLR